MGGAVGVVASVASSALGGGGIAGIVGGVVTGGFGSFITGAIVNSVVGFALNSIASSIFGKEPSQPSGFANSFVREARDRTQTIRSSVQPRRTAYGRIKLSGPLIFASSTGTDNKHLHMVIALTGHEIQEIEEVYLDDRSENDSVISPYLRINKHLGTTTQIADVDLTADAGEWTSAHKLSEISYIYTRLEYNEDAFPGGAPQNFSGIVKGKKLYDFRDTTTAFSENPALAIYDFLTDTTYGLNVETDEIDTTSFTAAANTCEERVLLNTSESIGFKVQSTSDETMYQDGDPLDFRLGDGVRLTTIDTLPGGLSTGITYYFIESIYNSSLEKNLFKLATSYANALVGTAINITSSGAGAHTISKYDHMRYNCNGTFLTSDNPVNIIEDLLTSLGGVLVYSEGKYFLHAAESGASVKTFDEDDLIGTIRVRPAPGKRELFNSIRGTYIEPTKSWQATDYPPLTNSSYVTQDGGETIWRDIELAFTNNATRAQRIAKIHLEKSRQGITVDMPCKLTTFQIAVWDVISVTNTYMGWSAKEFRVLEWNLDTRGGINLIIQEEASASYDWNNGDSTTYDPAPNTNLPDPTSVTAPGIPSVTEILYSTLDGAGVKTRVDLTWVAAADGFVSQYEIQYKLSSDSEWLPVGIVSSSVTISRIIDLAAGNYDFRVRSISGIGVKSSWSTKSNFEVVGLTALPADIENFSLNAINNNAHLRWDQAADLDVRIGGKIRLRFTSLTSGAVWSNAVDLVPALSGISDSAVVPLLAGTYLIKAVDSSGNESENSTTIISTVANIVGMNAVATLTEDTAFTGDKNNMVAINNVLRLDGILLFDDASGDFDDAEGFFDVFGGTQLTGTYDFSSPIDTGIVATQRVTVNIKASVYDYTQFFDARNGNFDDASGFFDGDTNDITSGSVDIYVRTTNDDPIPSGGAAWSEFNKFFVGDYTARGFDFRLIATVDNSSYNIDISELGVTVDAPDIVDAASLTSSAGGATSISFSKSFVSTPNITATIQNGSSGDYFLIENATNTGFDLSVKDSGDNLVARSVEWMSRGY